MRVVGAMRVAALAAESHRCAEFVLAASRLMFCGGFDIDEPEAGADRLPVLTVGRMMFCGEGRLSEAAAARAAG